MTEDELEVRWKALAAVNASDAKLALELLKELRSLREYKSWTPTARPKETEALKNVDNARYVLSNIASMVTLAVKLGLLRIESLPPYEGRIWVDPQQSQPPTDASVERWFPADAKADFHKEVAAYDAKAKVFYACIVRQFLDLLNAGRHSRNKLDMPTPEDKIGIGLVEALAERMEFLREINLENDWLRYAYKAVVGYEAPRRPEGWGRSATAGGEMAGEAPKVAEIFGRHAAFARDLMKVQGAEELRAANTTDGVNKAASEWIDPEKLAAAATRAANGLPTETDPAATSANPEKPAGHYEKGSGV